MAEAARRPLTSGEVALAREAFGDRIDYDRVRICCGAGGNPAAAIAFLSPANDAITLIRTIFCKGEAVGDYCDPAHKGLFMHEMTHIWQYQTLGVVRFYLRYAIEFAASKFNARAMYQYQKDDPFAAAKLEAQAEMVRDYGRGGEWRAKAEKSLAHTGFYGL